MIFEGGKRGIEDDDALDYGEWKRANGIGRMLWPQRRR